MNLVCKIFGHAVKPHSYGKSYGFTVDGTGRPHIFASWQCERCKESVLLNLHAWTMHEYDKATKEAS